MKYGSIVVLVVLFLAVPLMAQDSEVAKLRETEAANSLGVKPVASPFSLLDFSRMKWTNSYSISWFSGSGSSGSVGLLNSTMFYEFSPKLSMTLNIGILHNTGAIWGDANNDATLLPGFQLDYHPSDKFSLSVGVSRQAGWLSPYYYYPGPRYPYGHSLFPY